MCRHVRAQVRQLRQTKSLPAQALAAQSSSLGATGSLGGAATALGLGPDATSLFSAMMQRLPPGSLPGVRPCRPLAAPKNHLSLHLSLCALSVLAASQARPCSLLAAQKEHLHCDRACMSEKSTGVMMFVPGPLLATAAFVLMHTCFHRPFRGSNSLLLMAL